MILKLSLAKKNDQKLGKAELFAKGKPSFWSLDTVAMNIFRQIWTNASLLSNAQCAKYLRIHKLSLVLCLLFYTNKRIRRFAPPCTTRPSSRLIHLPKAWWIFLRTEWAMAEYNLLGNIVSKYVNQNYANSLDENSCS